MTIWSVSQGDSQGADVIQDEIRKEWVSLA